MMFGSFTLICGQNFCVLCDFEKLLFLVSKMNLNIVCNGKSSSNLPAQTTNKNGNCHILINLILYGSLNVFNFFFFQEKLATVDFVNIPNLNWLIHMAYARHDFNYCKDVIDHQFRVTYDHEYLYLVKGMIARDEGNLHESLQSLQKAIELNPDGTENLKEIGKTL